MEKRSKLGPICSLVCAAGSFWLALTELFGGVSAVPRRAVRVLVWLASCAVWTANLAVELWVSRAECAADPD